MTASRCLNWNDRATIAHLVSRIGMLRADMAERQVKQGLLDHLSPYQLDVLEECLLTRLTLMTQQGWCWFREDADLTVPDRSRGRGAE